MSMWLLLAAVMIPQEFASTAIVFVLALEQNFPIWAINLIWIGTTSLDMYVGWALGRFTHDRLHGTRFFNWVEKWIQRGRAELGMRGERFSLAMFGVVDFPYVNTFIGAWIGMSFRTAYLLTLAGNFVWLLFLWGTVLGLSAFVSNPEIIFLILLAVGILSHFLVKLFRPNKG